VLDLAAKTVRATLTSPELKNYDDLYNLKAVQALKGGPHNILYQLLHVFAAEDVHGYNKLTAESKKELASVDGFDYAVGLKKIRTLTIFSLSGGRDRIPYATLLKELELKDNLEVEQIIIDAVLSGRIDAKLDEEHEEVFIERSVPRIVSQESWRTMGEKLESWRQNVDGVLATLQQAQQARGDRNRGPVDGEEEDEEI